MDLFEKVFRNFINNQDKYNDLELPYYENLLNKILKKFKKKPILSLLVYLVN